jgi:hypothetical protein
MLISTPRSNEETSQGAFLDEWGDFVHPMGIYIDGARAVYVTDQIPRPSKLTQMVALLVGVVRSCMAHAASEVMRPVACTSRSSPPLDRITRLVPLADLPRIGSDL